MRLHLMMTTMHSPNRKSQAFVKKGKSGTMELRFLESDSILKAPDNFLNWPLFVRNLALIISIHRSEAPSFAAEECPTRTY